MQAAANPLLSYPATSMKSNQKKQIALQVIQKQCSITQVSKAHQVSRKFIYKQKAEAYNAIENAFSEPGQNDEKVLFHIPVTKQWLAMVVVCLLFHARCPFRGVIKIFKDIFDCELSLGTIHNISAATIERAQVINGHEELSNVRLGAHDEKFQYNQPILSGTDIPSLYCYLLSKENQRDGETWAIHLWDLQKKGLRPERLFADDGDGLRAGHKLALPNTPLDLDNFHISQDLMDCRRYFRNRLKTAVTYLKEQNRKMEKAKEKGNHAQHIRTLGLAKKEETKMRYLSESIDTLVSWMEHDVLTMPGYPPKERRELYDFIKEEFRKLEVIHPHRIKVIRTMLEDENYLALSFVGVLDEKFKIIAEQIDCTLETVWSVCQLQRYKAGGDTHAIRSIPLILQLGDELDKIEESVEAAINSTERTSSMAENLHSRISPYLFLRREIGHGFLDLLRFYLNHTPLLRSEREERKNKTPAEILSGRPHKNWLEMLGFAPFRLAA